MLLVVGVVFGDLFEIGIDDVLLVLGIGLGGGFTGGFLLCLVNRFANFHGSLGQGLGLGFNLGLVVALKRCAQFGDGGLGGLAIFGLHSVFVFGN